MKKALLIGFVLSLAFIAVSCALNAGYGPNTTFLWINDLPPEGEIYGVGSAK